MKWLYCLILLLILIGCGGEPNVPGSRWRSRRWFVPQQSGETVFVPLSGTWVDGGYWDMRAYDLEDGTPCPVLVPQEGVVNIVPLNNQNALIDATGLGGRRAVRLVPNGGTDHPALTADALSALMAGSDRTLSVVMRIQREIAASYRVFSFGNSLNNTNDFYDGFISAAGRQSVSKDAIGEATITHIGSTDLQFVPRVVAWVTDGTQVWEYLETNGVVALDAAFPLPLDTLPLTVNQFTFGTQRRVTIASPFQGWISNMALTPDILTLANIQLLSDTWIASDAPTIIGEPVMFLGDSITMGSQSTFTNGFRKEMWQAVVANAWNVNFVGTNFNGNFPDNEHSGLSGRTIGNIDGFVNVNFGPGNPFNGTKFTMLLIGTNNMGVGATPFSNPGTMNEYAALLENMTTREPTMTIGVSTIPAIDPALYPGPSANVNTFNTAITQVGGIWDTFEAAHPGILERSDSNTALGGPSFVPANYSPDGVHPIDPGYSLLAQHYLVRYGARLAAL